MASAIPVEKRTRTVAVRLSPGEESAWISAALAAGRRQLGAWVREVAVAGYLAGPRTSNPRETDPAVAGLRAELARLGNNVNQPGPGSAHVRSSLRAKGLTGWGVMGERDGRVGTSWVCAPRTRVGAHRAVGWVRRCRSERGGGCTVEGGGEV